MKAFVYSQAEISKDNRRNAFWVRNNAEYFNKLKAFANWLNARKIQRANCITLIKVYY